MSGWVPGWVRGCGDAPKHVLACRANENGEGFRDLAARYEAEFLRDMARLGIAPPDVLTRVSEYIPEVGPDTGCVGWGGGGGGGVGGRGARETR